MEQPRITQFTIPSAATGTDVQFVGNAVRQFLVISNITNFNAGSGNIVVTFTGSHSSGATSAMLPISGGPSITTGGNGIFALSGTQGIPYLSVHFGTAVTGSATNLITLISADDS